MLIKYNHSLGGVVATPTAPVMGGAGSTTVSGITDTTAILGGTYTNGGSPITGNGFVLYPSGNASTIIGGMNVQTINDPTLSSPLSEQANNLIAGTNYCFKPYAENSIGRSYGVELCFTTSNTPYVYVGNLGSSNTSKIDTSTNTLLLNIANSAIQPHGAIKVGQYVYVSLNAGQTLDKIDSLTNTIVSSMSLGGQGKYLTSDGTNLYVCISSSNTLRKIDIATFTTLSNITVGATPYQVKLYNGFAYVTNNAGGSISKVNTTTNTTVSTIGGFSNPVGIVIYNGFAYITNQGDNTVKRLDLSTDTITGNVGVGTTPYGIGQSQGFIYCTNQNGNSISKINTSMSVINTIPCSGNPLAFESNGNRGFIACFGSNECKILNTTNDTIIATIGVGSAPFAIAI